MKKHGKLRAGTAAALCLALGALLWLRGCFLPEVTRRAETAAAESTRYLTELSVASMDRRAGDAVRLVTDDKGTINAVRTDRDALTQFKTELDRQLWEQCSRINTELSLPLGLKAKVDFARRGSTDIRTELLPGSDGTPVYRILLRVSQPVRLRIGKKEWNTVSEFETTLFEAILR